MVSPPRSVGPRWTTTQLAGALAIRFGTTAAGTPDTAAAAAELGVSRRTVQRWLHGSRRARANIPAARLTQITCPDPQALRQEDLNARYARDAIGRIALPKGRGVDESWRRQRWLEPHLVAVLEVRVPALKMKLRQVSVSRGSDRSMRELRRRGELVDFITVPTRFHATALVHELLQIVGPWRVLPRPDQVAQGRTQTWTVDAPAPDLAPLAVSHGLR